MITVQQNPDFNNSAIVVFLYKTSSLNDLPFKDKKLKDLMRPLLAESKFKRDKDQIVPFFKNNQTIIFAGLGPKEELSGSDLRLSVRQTLLNGYLKQSSRIIILPPDAKTETVTSIIEGVMIGTYTWDKYKTKSEKDEEKIDKQYIVAAQPKQIYEEAAAILQGVTLARDLVNDNADLITSDYIEKVVRDLIKGNKSTQLTVLNEKELKANGLNLHLAVNQGSPKEPKLVIVEYKGSPKKSYDLALIGKGITFDTGGLNLKPSGSMDCMRLDMGGTAAVIGTLKNVLSLRIKKNILFVCGLAENAAGSKSYKPGDVFKSYSGKYVEIANTDAEGRLVLADAISYVIKNYKPKKIIDLATLTGACIVALGYDYTGLMSTDEVLAKQLLQSAEKTDDRAWRLPLYPELKEAVKSQIADIKNLGFPKGAAGTLTAAEFLRQFTEDTPWAHFDIAGTAFVESASRSYYSYGATGSGVRLLTHFLQNN